MVGRQPYAPAAFTPGKILGAHFQGLSRFRRGEPRKKFPVTTSGIDLGTSRLVAQCLNHYTNPGPNATEALHNYPLFQGCTSVGYRRAIKFLVVVPDILGMTTVIFFPYINKSTKPHAPSRKRQITLRFTGHSRTVGPRHEICFVPILWRLEFGGGSPIFGKFVTPDSFNEYVENKLSIIRGIDVQRRAAVLI